MLRGTRIASIGLVAAALFGTVACSDSGPETGTVKVRLSNASVAAAVLADEVVSELETPLPEGSLEKVELFVVRIDARVSEPTEAEATEATEESEAEQRGWVTVAEPNAKIDLMALAGGTAALLGEATVDAGAYRGFRIIIDPAQSSITLDDEAGTVIGGESIVGLKFPSAAKTGVKINLTGGPLEVEADDETSVLVTFDVSRSFVMRGATIEQNGLLFKPVIKAQQVAEAP